MSPLSRYNKEFGGKKGSAAKAQKAMSKTYKNPKKADEVFYALVNKKKGARKGKGKK